MTMTTGLTRWIRNIAIGVLAIGATALMLPGAAVAGMGPDRIADRLQHISYQVDRIGDIRGARQKDRQIDALQSRLHRLERISDRQRGRRARHNDAIIDRLQHRLNRMERRVEARIDRRRDDRGYWRRDDRRDRDRSHRKPVHVYGSWGN